MPVQPANVSVEVINSDLASVGSAIETFITGASTLVEIHGINIVRNKNSNDVMAYVTWESS